MDAAKPKSRLGRGLQSLMASSAPAPPASDPTQPAPATPPPTSSISNEIRVDQIKANPYQPRRSMDTDKLVELAASLKSTGLIQPIVVKPVEDGYELIAGERRWRAADMAGFKTIPAIIRDVDVLTQAQMALVENIQRADLNAIDRANAYQLLIAKLGLTQGELAGRLGEDRSSVANYLRLLDLDESVRQRVASGLLSLGHAKLLAGVEDVVEQRRLAELVIAQGLSVRNLERLVQQEAPIKKLVPTKAREAYLADLEKTISRHLGLRASVESSAKGKGKLVVHYTSLKEFDQLMTSLGVKMEE